MRPSRAVRNPARGRWRRRTVLAVAMMLTVGGASVADPAGASPAGVSPASTLQADVDHLHAIGTTGVLAEAVDANTVLRARAGTARLGTTAPVNWASHFRIGSTTKTFVATVILQLVAEGRLRLTDTVESRLPGLLHGRGNNGAAITVRHLLQHTSGLYDYVADDDFFGAMMTPEAFAEHRFDTYRPEDLVAVALRHAPNFAPGARWEYSNTNYIVAGLLIKAVTGRRWSQEVHQRIVVPLGLSGTSEPGTDPALPLPAPHGYQLFGTDGTYTDTTLHNMTWGDSAGSLISTPRDVNTFLRALMSGRLLPAAQLAEMRRTVPMGRDYEEIWPGAAYGLGLIRTDLPCGGVYWHHGGDVIGYSDTNGVTPDGARSAMVASATNTFTDPVFAAKSIAGTNQLVWHALCRTAGGPVAAATAAGPGNGPSRRPGPPRAR